MKRVGIIGYGTVGKAVADAILAGRVGGSLLVAVLVRSTTATTSNGQAIDDCLITDNDNAFFSQRLDVVIETAGHEAVHRYARKALLQGSDMIVVSVGAFCDTQLLDEVMTAAKEKGRRIILPAAAIAGLDRLAAAAQGPMENVTLTTKKPVKAWRGTFAEQVVDLDSVSEPIVIYEGDARESSRVFPESVNVSAALSLAGIGFEATRVKVIVDPTIDKNVHQVVAQGLFGRVSIEVQNTPSPANPKTGHIVAMSIQKALKELTAPLILS